MGDLEDSVTRASRDALQEEYRKHLKEVDLTKQPIIQPMQSSGWRSNSTSPFNPSQPGANFGGNLVERLDYAPEKEVLAWEVEYDRKTYSYVAIKAGGRWYTSATDANTQIDQVLESRDLAHLLYKEAHRLWYAHEWKEIR